MSEFHREIQKILRETNQASENSKALELLKDFHGKHPEISLDEFKYESSGDTILHIASAKGHLELVKYLLNHFSVDCRNKDNKSPLHEACQNGHIEIARELLNSKADVNALKKADWTPLMLACTKITSENEAAKRKILAELLLEYQACVNFQNKDGWSSLHISVREGDISILKLLIQNGLNLNSRTKNGNTALHIAALHGHLEIFKLLSSLNQDLVQSQNNQGNYPLHEAILSKELKMVKLAVTYYNHEDLMTTNKSGFNILHLSVFIGCLDILKFLVDDFNMDLHTKTLYEQNCLHLASSNSFWEVFKFCLDKGIDPNARDKHGRLPSDYNK